MKRPSLNALLCILFLGLNSTLTYATDDLPAWITGTVSGQGVDSSAEAESEEQALVEALFQLAQNISTQFEAQKRQYNETQSIDAPDQSAPEITKMITQQSFGNSLTVKGMVKLEPKNDSFSSLFKISFSQGEKYRNYSYTLVAKQNGSNPLQNFSVENNQLSYHQLKNYLRQNGFSILTYQGMHKNEPMEFVWLDYQPKQP